ncbi:MAG: glutamine--tRNA ligase/YqeY domain fusion protein [Spirochaetales bacterium]|nr:glutamine--tRNA ligase/YqeY domain fusion protein [Spirochaetales bacterium]
MEELKQEQNKDFIRQRVEADIEAGKNHGKVVTRFPPEPNGYLHIGHAKAFCIDFGIAEEYGGRCHLRLDDTNPEKEDVEYIESIKEDIHWMGFDWGEHLYFASDYFAKLYEYAVELIKKGGAYVCDLSPDQIREYRGTLTRPGKDSPFRNRTVEENLDLFERMRAGEFEEGACVLRAKIDMSSPNINLRDPALYRIKKVTHHRTGDTWCIYPMYDFAHSLSDAIEGITHSLCSLEFENNRPLYEWFLAQLDVPGHPQQIEFARLNLTYTIMSKRKLLKLVQEKIVKGWDDPRMPTLCGLRRRGYTAASIRTFIEKCGVAKVNSVADIALLEHCLREELNKTAPRVMAVLKPLKVIIDDYPEDKVEMLEAENNPEDQNSGARQLPFSREVYIEQDDFMEDPPKKFYRLSPGKEIRLKHAYYIKCCRVVKDENTGQIKELHCTYDPASKGGWTDDGRVVRGTSHWVSVAHAVRAEIRLYDHLFTKENPDDAEEGGSFLDNINPESQELLASCLVEPGLKTAKPGERFQFLRQGYFCLDPDSTGEHLVFNRTVTLRDTWSRIQKAQQQKS